MTDDLETILGSNLEVGINEGRRAEVLAASTRIVRRRAAARKLGRATAFGVVLMFGAAAGWVLKPAQVVREIVYLTPPPPPPVVEPPVPQPRPLSPNELEQQAELSDDKVQVARLYREAGDLYLNGDRDYAEAARCYRLSLNAAGSETRKVSTDDSWLLISMKTTLPKE